MGLAEKRTKQRIVADPQNKKWSENKEGFGFKMLQRMGWSEGKGLGAKLDGTLDYVKVSVKADSAGLGVTKRDILEDTYGQTKGYDDLLKSLAAVEEVPKELSKDKRRSKKVKENTRSNDKKNKKEKKDKKDKRKSDKRKEESAAPQRIHRKKFIQNKDVSAYSEVQLREIFGV